MSKKSKKLLALTTVILMIAVSAITVAAYLFINSGSVYNTFKPAEDPKTVVQEDSFDGETKTNVKVNVGNTGYEVYVRAAIVVTWKSDKTDDVKVLADVPELDTDYTMSLNEEDWLKGNDGFYYHKVPVSSSGSTAALINQAHTDKSVTYKGESYYVSINIISQTIQALGTTDAGEVPAVVDAWGDKFTFDADGNITSVN